MRACSSIGKDFITMPNVTNENGSGCPAVPQKIQASPDEYPQRGCSSKDRCKNRENGSVENESTQDGSERHSKKHREHRSPKLCGGRGSLPLKQSKPGGNEEPGEDHWHK